MDELRHFTCKVLANTPATAPLSFAHTMPPRVATAVQIIIPPGPSGLVGFAITQGGVRVIPYGSDPWVITDNEKIEWPLANYNNAGSWGLMAYNTGTQDHTIYVRYLLDVPGLHTAASAGPGVGSVFGLADYGYDVAGASTGGG